MAQECQEAGDVRRGILLLVPAVAAEQAIAVTLKELS